MQKETDSMRRDFILNANLWKVLLKISLPLIIYNAFNYLYGLLDAIMVANIGSKEVSAVVFLDQIRTMLFTLGMGLAAGGTIIISRLIGRNEYDKAKTVANTMICVAVIVALATLTVVIPLTPIILRLTRTPEELISIGTGYFIVQIITVGVSLFNNVFLGFEKARGSTRNILYLNIGVMVVKVSLTALFVFYFKTGITMVAVATLIANALLSIYIIFRLMDKKYLFKFSFKNKNLSAGFLKPIVVLSFPIFLGRFVFSLGKVIINAMCGHYGDTVVGALGVSNQLGGSVTNILSSVEDANATIISQNLGNGNQKRALNAFFIGLTISVSLAIVGVVLLTIFNDPIIAYFSRDAENGQEFGHMINEIFKYEKIGVLTLSLNSAVLGLLYGYGYTRITMFTNLSRLFVFRIPSLYFLMNFTSLGYESVGIAMMVSNGGIGIMSLVIGIIYIIKIKKRNEVDKLKI